MELGTKELDLRDPLVVLAILQHRYTTGLLRPLKRGDLDRVGELQGIAADMVRVLVRFGGLPATKAMMRIVWA